MRGKIQHKPTLSDIFRHLSPRRRLTANVVFAFRRRPLISVRAKSRMRRGCRMRRGYRRLLIIIYSQTAGTPFSYFQYLPDPDGSFLL